MLTWIICAILLAFFIGLCVGVILMCCWETDSGEPTYLENTLEEIEEMICKTVKKLK